MAKLKKPRNISSSSDGPKQQKLLKKVSQKKNKNKIKLAPHILQDEKSRIKKRQKLDIHKDLNEEIPKYNISIRDVKNAINGVIKFRAENPKLKNELFDESLPVYLQISCHRVPTGYPKIFRIPLKHSLYSTESEICLVTSEVKGIRNIEHERHIEHYEKLLQDKGVENIKKIMTFHEFRTSYETFEQKNRLVDLYDVFLADSKISGKLVKKCGKIFYKKRKVPTAVKLQVTKLKDHIEKALRKAFLNLHLKGNSYTVQFGHTRMKEDELVQNFKSILDFLDNFFPGGVDNISGLTVYVHRGSSIPVYISTKPAKDLTVPKVMSKKPKAFKTFKGELTTLPNADVTVKPSGRVIVKRTTDGEGRIEEEHAKKKEVQNKRTRDHEVEDEGESVSKVKKNKTEINADGVQQSPAHKKKKTAPNKVVDTGHMKRKKNKNR